MRCRRSSAVLQVKQHRKSSLFFPSGWDAGAPVILIPFPGNRLQTFNCEIDRSWSGGRYGRMWEQQLGEY
jgi:hypothetical protein